MILGIVFAILSAFGKLDEVTQDGIFIKCLAGCRGCLDEHSQHTSCPLRAQSQRHFNVKGRTIETQGVSTVVSVVEMRSVLTSPARQG